MRHGGLIPMGLFDFFKRLLFGSPAQAGSADPPLAPSSSPPAEAPAPRPTPVTSPQKPSTALSHQRHRRKNRDRPRLKLRPLKYRSSLIRTPPDQEHSSERPYAFAVRCINPRTGERIGFLDYSQDADERWLSYYGLPPLKTPQDLAEFLDLSVGKLAWLTQRHHPALRPPTAKESHYHYHWIKKRSGGFRLLEAPKETLKDVQEIILDEILDKIPTHPAAHGFVEGRSILTNARPHVGRRFVLKMDLKDFYPTVKYRRIVAVFRSIGFSREVSIWLARLTSTTVPLKFSGPDTRPGWHYSLEHYWRHHLPQGAPTSPALANLSAYSLDVRLSGLAAKYHLKYTRYADDLTFSGDGRSLAALSDFIPLAQLIIRDERFQLNSSKRKVLRDNQRQVVTGVVVNDLCNVSRDVFDELKAILHNCLKQGAASQNRNQHPQFAAHIRGRIAHIMQLNPRRGEKLLALYQKINWTK